MKSSAEIINKIKNAINEDVDLSKDGEAVRAFEKTTLPVPLKKTYFSLSCEDNTLTKGNPAVNKISIRMTCFTPLTKPAYTANETAENILHYMEEIFSDDLISYSIGETDYDDDVRAYKVICRLQFQY